MVGFFVSKDDYTSTMTFGGYDETMLKQGSEADGYGIHWYPLTNTIWWQVEI